MISSRLMAQSAVVGAATCVALLSFGALFQSSERGASSTDEYVLAPDIAQNSASNHPRLGVEGTRILVATQPAEVHVITMHTEVASPDTNSRAYRARRQARERALQELYQEMSGGVTIVADTPSRVWPGQRAAAGCYTANTR